MSVKCDTCPSITGITQSEERIAINHHGMISITPCLLTRVQSLIHTPHCNATQTEVQPS